jgi:hypothetical protein
MMLALPCYIQKKYYEKKWGQKKIKKIIMLSIKEKKKIKKREKEDSPLLDLCYHEGHGPNTLTMCVV